MKVRVPNPGRSTLGNERHHDRERKRGLALLGPTLGETFVCVVVCEFPLAIEGDPVLAHELGARICAVLLGCVRGHEVTAVPTRTPLSCEVIIASASASARRPAEAGTGGETPSLSAGMSRSTCRSKVPAKYRASSLK